MRPPGLAVSPEQRIIVGFDKHQGNRMVFAQVFQQARQFLQLQTLTSILQERRPFELGFAGLMQLRKNGNQFHRQVVHAVEAHVFKCAQHGAFAGAGKPGQDDQLARFSFYSRLHGGGGGQLLTLRWCVLGMRISSRYLATVRRVTWIPASSSFWAMCSSVSGFAPSSSSIIFLTTRFSVSSDIPLPSGPFTDSLKNERNSSAPCGVCAYLLATARLTVEGCTPTSSATSLIIMGFSASCP